MRSYVSLSVWLISLSTVPLSTLLLVAGLSFLWLSNILLGSTDAEGPLLYPPDAKNWLIRKDPNAGKDWKWEEKGMTEDEMAGWYCRLNRLEFEQAPGVGDGQGSLACCSPWGHKESDTTERLNWLTEYSPRCPDVNWTVSYLREAQPWDVSDQPPQGSRSQTPGSRFAWSSGSADWGCSHTTLPTPSPRVVGEGGDAKQLSASTSFQSAWSSRKVCLEGHQLSSAVSSCTPFPLFSLWGCWLCVVWAPIPVASQRQVPYL